LVTKPAPRRRAFWEGEEEEEPRFREDWIDEIRDDILNVMFVRNYAEGLVAVQLYTFNERNKYF